MPYMPHRPYMPPKALNALNALNAFKDLGLSTLDTQPKAVICGGIFAPSKGASPQFTLA